MSSCRTRKFISQITRSVIDQEGAILAELALILTPLLLLLILATDFALERLADAQVQNAVVAAGNYATNKGCSSAGMYDAALNSIDKSIGGKFILDPSKIGFDIFPSCLCGLTDVSPDAAQEGVAVTPPLCEPSNLCSATVDSVDLKYHAAPYVSITATANYDGFFTGFLRSITPQAVINYTLMVRTFAAPEPNSCLQASYPQ
jgi:Flp pilus assembly protein TadG